MNTSKNPKFWRIKLCLFALRYAYWAKEIAEFNILAAANLKNMAPAVVISMWPFLFYLCDRKSNLTTLICVQETMKLFKIKLQEHEKTTWQGKFLSF